mmetsp:Transcript_20879/g.32232  ORF Transcript_20879/g.32232 Transcript_20879/m.32232 type:complete len:201 (+) Transcript_20879:1205-1807(+)
MSISDLLSPQVGRVIREVNPDEAFNFLQVLDQGLNIADEQLAVEVALDAVEVKRAVLVVVSLAEVAFFEDVSVVEGLLEAPVQDMEHLAPRGEKFVLEAGRQQLLHPRAHVMVAEPVEHVVLQLQPAELLRSIELDRLQQADVLEETLLLSEGQRALVQLRRKVSLVVGPRKVLKLNRTQGLLSASRESSMQASLKSPTK